MARSRRFLYLTFSGLVGFILTLTVTTCGGGSGSGSGSGSGAPTSPRPSAGGAANAGMVAGTGTCRYSATPTSFVFGPSADTGEVPVTVTGVAANGERCTWWAESHTLSNDWISVVSCPGGICYGTQTVQVVVQPGDVPAQGPAPRSGTVGIWKNVGATFEKEFDVPISQTAGR